MQDPITTPTRSRACPSRPFPFPISPADPSASLAAASVYCVTRSVRFRSLAGRRPSGSKPFTSPAIRTGNELASNDRIQSTPLRPATSAVHVPSIVVPTGVTAPTPVTTTLRTDDLTMRGCPWFHRLQSTHGPYGGGGAGRDL